MTLTEFVKARLDERAAAARESLEATARSRARGLSSTIWDEQDAAARRELREVAALRVILAEHEITDQTPKSWPGVGYGCVVCHEDDGCIAPRGYCTTLRALGAIDSGHPDYDPAWASPAVAAH